MATKMLLKLSTLICFMLAISTAIRAENKTDEFAAFHTYNQYALGKYVAQPMFEQCMASKKDAEFCKNDTSDQTTLIMSYYTYRMTTEKNMDFYKLMVECGKNKTASPECPSVTSYVQQLQKDYQEKVVPSYVKLAKGAK